MSSASGAAHLAQDDAVGAHAQRIAHQRALRHFALAFDVRRARLQAHHVRLAQLQLGRVLDRHDALVAGNEAGDQVEQRGLAAAGAARDQDVHLGQAQALQHLDHGRRDAFVVEQVLHRQRTAPKRRIDTSGPSTASGGMIAFTREPSGRRASTIGLDSSTRRPTRETIFSMIFIRCALSWKVMSVSSSAAPLDVHLAAGVDQDVGHGRVVQQRLERAEAEHLVLDVEHQVMALLLVQDDALFLDDALDQQRQLVLELLAGQALQALQVDPVEDHLVHRLLQFLVGLLRRFRHGWWWRSSSVPDRRSRRDMGAPWKISRRLRRGRTGGRTGPWFRRRGAPSSPRPARPGCARGAGARQLAAPACPG
jgi:hypothetical protein